MSTISSGMTYDEYLSHYGVKGMKWGRRKNSDGSKMSRSANKKAARAERDLETEARMKSASGSLAVRKAKVGGAIVAKTLASNLALEVAGKVGSNVAGSATQNIYAASGARAAANIHAWNLTIAAIKDVDSVRRYQE